jgi:hypothetical protein
VDLLSRMRERKSVLILFFPDPILVSCVNLQLSVYYIVELALLRDKATDTSSYAVLPLC